MTHRTGEVTQRAVFLTNTCREQTTHDEALTNHEGESTTKAVFQTTEGVFNDYHQVHPSFARVSQPAEAGSCAHHVRAGNRQGDDRQRVVPVADPAAGDGHARPSPSCRPPRRRRWRAPRAPPRRATRRRLRWSRCSSSCAATSRRTADANMENGASIIQSAGIAVKKTPVRAAARLRREAGCRHRHR